MSSNANRFVHTNKTLVQAGVLAVIGLGALSLGCSEESSDGVDSRTLAINEVTQELPAPAEPAQATPDVSGEQITSRAVVRKFPTTKSKAQRGGARELRAPSHQIPPGMKQPSDFGSRSMGNPSTPPLEDARPSAFDETASELQGLAPSPAPVESFLALPETGWIPPDTNGAVGPDHLMVVLNGAVAVQTREGALLSQTTLIEFFNPVNINFDVFDPLVRYDPFEDRWIIAAMADRAAAVSAVVLAVSQTGDPTGSWNFYRFDADPSDQGWADFPKIGFNKNWIVVAANLIGGPNSVIFACNKQAIYAGSGTCTRFSYPFFFVIPAVEYDPNLEPLYLARHLDPFAGTMAIDTLSGPVNAPTITQQSGVIAAPLSWSTFTFEQAPQLGRPERIEPDFYPAIASLVYRNGSLWGAQTVYLPTDHPTRGAIQWWQVAPHGSLEQFGRLDDPNFYYAYPSIAVNKDNDVLLGYARFSPNQYASGNYSFRYGTDPSGTLRDDTILKAGEAPYFKDYGSGRNRWGDYSQTVVDPVNDTDMWTIQEYAALPESTWGTWWGKVSVDVEPPPSAHFIEAHFTTSSDGFSYLDDAFFNTNQPDYASGTYEPTGSFDGGGLAVTLGNLDSSTRANLSGAWERTFTLSESASVNLSLRYNLTLAPHYESDEFSDVLVAVDGVLRGSGPNGSLVRVHGDGEGGPEVSTGWVLFQSNLGTLSAGTHVLRIGGFNNKKTAQNEWTIVRFDDVIVSLSTPQNNCTTPLWTPGFPYSVGQVVRSSCDTSTVGTACYNNVGAMFSWRCESTVWCPQLKPGGNQGGWWSAWSPLDRCN